MKKILFAMLLMTSVNTYAGFYTGNKLLEDLQATESMKYAFGVTYLMGISDIEEMHIALDSGKKQLSRAYFCVPDGVVIKQLADVVKPYLLNHPTTRHYNAAFLVRAALVEAWPCPFNP